MARHYTLNWAPSGVLHTPIPWCSGCTREWHLTSALHLVYWGRDFDFYSTKTTSNLNDLTERNTIACTRELYFSLKYRQIKIAVLMTRARLLMEWVCDVSRPELSVPLTSPLDSRTIDGVGACYIACVQAALVLQWRSAWLCRESWRSPKERAHHTPKSAINNWN